MINFPDSPSLGATFSAVGIEWQFDGVKWLNVTPADGDGGGGSSGLSGMTAGQIPIAASATTVTSSGNLSGAVTTSGSLATTLVDAAVTYSKIQNVAAARLVGNPTGGAAAPSEISLGTNLSFSGSVLNAAGGGLATPVSVANGGTGLSSLAQYGVVVGSGTTPVLVQAPGVNGTIFASNGPSANPSYRTLTTLLDTLAGTAAQGQIWYRGSVIWQVLTPGTAGQFLQTGGAGANLSWATPAGGGGTAATKTTNYTVVAGDLGNTLVLGGATATLTLPAGIFTPGSTLRVAVTASVSWSITNLTGLALAGLNSTSLQTGSSGIFIANADGATLNFIPGVQSPTTASLGSVNARTAVANNFVTGLNVSGVLTAAQPSFSNLSGTATYAQIQNVAAASLLGNPTGAGAAPSEITLGTNLSFSGTVLNATGGGGVAEAPLTGELYARESAAWAAIPRITVAATAPASPATDDVWIDTAGAGGITEAEADARYVNLAGDTMSDNLTINNATDARTSYTSGAHTGYFGTGGGEVWLGSSTNTSVGIYVGDVYRVVFPAAGGSEFTGALGVGATPQAKLHVKGAGQTTASVDTSGALPNTLLLSDSGLGVGNGGMVVFGAGDDAWRFAAIKALTTSGGGNSQGDLAISTRRINTDGTLTEAMRVLASGSVIIGAPTGGGMGAGTLNATAVYAMGSLLTSDATLKIDVEPLAAACLPLVTAVKPKTWRWQEPGDAVAAGRRSGFAAQDLAEADVPGIVEGKPGEGMAVDVGAMLAVLWQAMRELSAEVAALKAKP